MIKTLGDDRGGPILDGAETLSVGRTRFFEQEPGRQALILPRSSDLIDADLSAQT